MSSAAQTEAVAGLRERKKRRTRELIQREALRLFTKQGYDATTVEQIAAAADISPSTFFNYFPTKEDVVLMDAYDPLVERELRERPADEPVVESIAAALSGAFASTLARDRDVILARARIMLETPSVRARLWDELQRSEDFIAAILAGRSGRDPDDFELRITVGLLTGALFAAVKEWARDGGRDDFADVVRRAMRVVETGELLR